MKKIRSLVLFILLTACASAPVAEEPPLVEAPAPAFTSNPTAKVPPTPIPTLEPTLVAEEPGRIAFTSEVDGEQKIYVIDADGSDLVELASDILSKFYPDWSADGANVSFFSAAEKSAILYTMNADGSSLVKVLDTSEMSAYDQISPDSTFGMDCCISAWSPDGGKIILRTSRGTSPVGSLGHIHVLNFTNNQMYDFRAATWARVFWSADSSKFGVIGAEDRCEGRQLCVMKIEDGKPVDLKGITGVTFPSQLYWSPDGNKITFSAFLGDSKNMDVYVADADFSNPVNITNSLTKGQNVEPVWSPDGRKIAFTSCDVYLCELYVVNADGSDLIKLTPQALGLNNVIWSYDGEKIIYVSDENGNSEIYAVNLTEQTVVNLTSHPSGDRGPIWSPDGTKLAFVSDRDGDDDIYILDPETMDLFNLTDNDVDDHSPFWQP